MNTQAFKEAGLGFAAIALCIGIVAGVITAAVLVFWGAYHVLNFWVNTLPW